MKRSTTIVLFASIFAVAVGTLGLSGNTSALMVSAVPQAQEGISVLGHVEYKLLDEFGDIKGYMQNDNVVVEMGKDCAASYLFTDSSVAVEECIAGNNAFTYIGIGNGSSGTIAVGNQTLADSVDDENATCSASGGTGTAGGGDMARRNVTATFDSTGTSTIVTLDTSDTPGSDGPFTFDALNATDVIDSGLFNADYDNAGPTVAPHTCDAAANTPDLSGIGGDWNMFSRQLLNNADGITVTDGDSLSVKWTITIGTP